MACWVVLVVHLRLVGDILHLRSLGGLDHASDQILARLADELPITFNVSTMIVASPPPSVAKMGAGALDFLAAPAPVVVALPAVRLRGAAKVAGGVTGFTTARGCMLGISGIEGLPVVLAAMALAAAALAAAAALLSWGGAILTW
jgi:hypothetical protein